MNTGTSPGASSSTKCDPDEAYLSEGDMEIDEESKQGSKPKANIGPLAKHKQVWIFVGSSGSGKSSHVRLFADEWEEVEVSDAAESCTSSAKLCKHKSDPNVWLLDTVGFDDSTGLSDRQVMAMTRRALCEQKIRDVKVVWFVNRDIKMSQSLQRQAQFINSFQDGNIWRSTFLVVKEGERRKHAQGALAASEAAGRVDELQVVWHQCVDWIQEDMDRDEVLEDMEDMSLEKRLKKGKLFEKEVKERLVKQLAAMPLARVISRIVRCTKCGQVGDEHCMPSRCHVKQRRVHKSKEMEHVSAVRWRHFGALKKSHPKKLEEKHRHATACALLHYHDETEPYHFGEKDERGWHKFRVAVTTVGVGNLLGAADRNWTCCQKAWEDPGCRRRCVNCKKETDAIGCRTRRPCGRQWCEIYFTYECCGRPETGEGCESQRECCGHWAKPWTEGCQSYFPCCDKQLDSTGCVHSCCKAQSGGEGCKTVCSQCGGKWNDKTVRACNEAEDHDLVPLVA